MKKEHQFSNLTREIRKKYVGNGPRESTTRFTDTWAINETRGNLTKVEKFMASTLEGKKMICEARKALVEKIYENQDILTRIEELLQAKIIRVFFDINVEEDIEMTIFVFDKPLENEAK
ncbi:DUF2294 domain-containing protein [Priestia megaterium]|jgi:uncharacterized protein YbcI